MVAVKLLEKKTDEYLASGTETSLIPNPIQAALLEFLDFDAPTVDSPSECMNVVLLFSELIRYGIFSHDRYMTSLITRGELTLNETKISSSAPILAQILQQGEVAAFFIVIKWKL